jgi:hypothetical protein
MTKRTIFPCKRGCTAPSIVNTSPATWGGAAELRIKNGEPCLHQLPALAFGPAEKVLPRWNIQGLLLLLASVVGLTWIRKRTIVVGRGEACRRAPIGPAYGPGHCRRAERRADKSRRSDMGSHGSSREIEGDGQKLGTAL